MNDWQKNRNFRKVKNDNGTFTYIITVDKQDVEVSEAVYKEYATSARRMEYTEQELKRNRVSRNPQSGKPVLDEYGQPIILPEREISLEKMLDEDWEFPSSEPSPEDVVIAELDMEALHRCLDLLSADERKLIDALFFEGFTEREYAKTLGVSQVAVNKRKNKVFEKLKNYLLKK